MTYNVFGGTLNLYTTTATLDYVKGQGHETKYGKNHLFRARFRWMHTDHWFAVEDHLVNCTVFTGYSNHILLKCVFVVCVGVACVNGRAESTSGGRGAESCGCFSFWNYWHRPEDGGYVLLLRWPPPALPPLCLFATVPPPPPRWRSVLVTVLLGNVSPFFLSG